MIPAVTAKASICFLSGSRINKTNRNAKAAANTAAFHIGNNPSSTPENMKPGTVGQKGCRGAAGGAKVSSAVGVVGIADFLSSSSSAEISPAPADVSPAVSGASRSVAGSAEMSSSASPASASDDASTSLTGSADILSLGGAAVSPDTSRVPSVVDRISPSVASAGVSSASAVSASADSSVSMVSALATGRANFAFQARQSTFSSGTAR